MAVRFILMMALMMIALADPVPDPDVIVDVKQEVNAGAGCGGGCCDDDCDSKGCWFDGHLYQNNHYLIETCAILICNDGEWDYKGMKAKCGKCIVAAEPWVKTFDNVKDAYLAEWYRTNGGLNSTNNHGKYTLTQDGNPDPSSFEVIGSFYYSSEWVATPGTHGTTGSYVNGFTYREDNSDTKRIVGTCAPGGGAAGDLFLPCATLKLQGPSGLIIAPFPKSVEDIWVFEHGDCIIIVGTKGLTMKVCPREAVPLAPGYKLPYVYMYASPTLSKSNASPFNKLYGLCNTYTGGIAKNYKAKSGWVPTDYSGCFPDTSAPTNIRYDIDTTCGGFVESWEAT